MILTEQNLKKTYILVDVYLQPIIFNKYDVINSNLFPDYYQFIYS